MYSVVGSGLAPLLDLVVSDSDSLKPFHFHFLEKFRNSQHPTFEDQLEIERESRQEIEPTGRAHSSVDVKEEARWD
jgi:hypothetical protein